MEKKIVIILCVLDVILLGFSIFLYVGEDRTTPVIVFGEEAPVAWAGYHRFADAQGNLIRTYVRIYADFAGASIPEGRGSLTGILQQDGTAADRYILKLRDETDFWLAE